MKTHHLFTFVLVLLTGSVLGAHNCYLELTLNGEAVEGESTTAAIGGVDVSTHIECLAFSHEVFRSTGLGGRHNHKPILLTKRVDQATPLLYNGLFLNQNGEAIIRFFRTDQDSGTTEHFQTITLTGVRVASVRRWQPSTLDPVGALQPLLEEVTLLYQEITIEHVSTSTSANATSIPGI